MNQLASKYEKIKQLVALKERYLPGTQGQELLQDYYQRLSETKPRVMMFGSYNAGKSTLINTLLGEEQAQVADIPTTDSVDRYEWLYGSLFDTPGINAPIEHENVTDEHINRTELMLFVIRAGDQDSKDVYQRMFELISRGKKLFIVFNHELSEEELTHAQEKLNATMVQYTSQYSLDLSVVGQIPLQSINVRTALRGRLKNSEALLEHAGYPEFEARFIEWLAQFSNQQSQKQQLQSFIEQSLFTPTLKAINAKLGAEDSNEKVNQLQYQRTQLEYKYQLLEASLRNEVRALCTTQKGNIANLLTSTEGPQLESQLQNLASQIAADTSELLQQKCTEIEQNLQVTLSNPNAHNLGLSVAQNNTGVMVEMIGGRVADVLKSEQTTAPVIKQGLLWLRSQGLKPFKGRWEKTLTKWAGVGAKRLNIAVQVAASTYELYAANRDQNTMNEQERKASLGLHQAVDSISSDIFNAINTDVSSLLVRAKENSLTSIETELSAGIAQLNSHQRAKEQLLLLTQQVG